MKILRELQSQSITKTYLYNVDPLKPHFYIVKVGFTGVYIIFLISAQKQGSSNEYPQSMFRAEIWKISDFLSENFQFLVVKFSIYLNRRVFIMHSLPKAPKEEMRSKKVTFCWNCCQIMTQQTPHMKQEQVSRAHVYPRLAAPPYQKNTECTSVDSEIYVSVTLTYHEVTSFTITINLSKYDNKSTASIIPHHSNYLFMY